MEYLTREQFDKIFKDKSVIEPEDLVYVLEEKLGYSVSLKKRHRLTEGDKRRMTKAIFSNEEILKQLQESAANQNYIYDEEEFTRFVEEVRSAR